MSGKLRRLEVIVSAKSQAASLRAKRRSPAEKRTAQRNQIEDERARIARELHAGAGQPLSGILLNLQILRESAGLLPARAQEALSRLEVLTDQALQQVRAVSHRLHPPAWQELTTIQAIQTLVNTSGLCGQFDIELSTGLIDEPPSPVKVAVYRCTQECLSNIVRHSGATKIRISLDQQHGYIDLRVEDNGHGFRTEATSSGIGLRAIEEHARNVSGSCRVHTSTTGTEIIVSIPAGDQE